MKFTLVLVSVFSTQTTSAAGSSIGQRDGDGIFQDLNFGGCMDGDERSYDSYITHKTDLEFTEDTSDFYGPGRRLWNLKCASCCHAYRTPGLVAFQTTADYCSCLYSAGYVPTNIPEFAFPGWDNVFHSNNGCAQGQASVDHGRQAIRAKSMCYPVKNFDLFPEQYRDGQAECLANTHVDSVHVAKMKTTALVLKKIIRG